MAEQVGFQRAVPTYAGDPTVNAAVAARLKATAAQPQTLSSPPAAAWADTAKSLWNAITQTPARLRQAFTFSRPALGPDPMSKIQGTAVQGAKGFQNVRKQLSQLAQ